MYPWLNPRIPVNPEDVCTGYDKLVKAIEDPAIKGLFVPLEGVENTGPIAGFAERSTRTGNLRSSDRTTSR